MKQRIYDQEQKNDNEFPAPHLFAICYLWEQLQNGKSLQECGLNRNLNKDYYVKLRRVTGAIELNTRFGQSLIVELKQKQITAKDVKTEVLRKYGVPIDNQILCFGEDDDEVSNVLEDDCKFTHSMDGLKFDLIIVEDAAAALADKDELWVASRPRNHFSDEEKEIDPVLSDSRVKRVSPQQKYPIFLRNENDEILCVFIHFAQPLGNELLAQNWIIERRYNCNIFHIHWDCPETPCPWDQPEYRRDCITAPPKLNGHTLQWNKSLMEQGIGPETILNVLQTHFIWPVTVKCAYFRELLLLVVSTTWTMSRVKEEFIKGCKLNDHSFEKNIIDKEMEFSIDDSYIFGGGRSPDIAQGNIIEKTFGNGLAAFHNETRLCYEYPGKISDFRDTLLFVPSFTFKVSFVYKGQMHRNAIQVHSLDHCDVVYRRICDRLKLNVKRTLLKNEGGSLKPSQRVESANLFKDNIVHVMVKAETRRNALDIVKETLSMWMWRQDTEEESR